MLPTRTTTALLDGLTDSADAESWRQFDERYRPIICAFAQRLGLAAEDAADVAQEVLVRFLKSYRGGKYDRGRGRLRSWLIGIARHCISDLRQRRAARREHRGISALVETPAEDELVRAWDLECKRAMIRQALTELQVNTRMDERTIRVFAMLAIEERPADEVAGSLGISRNEVYLAKHRCLSRMQKILSTLKATYDDGDGTFGSAGIPAD
ncbi:MAG: RNA polymerase sigma factor [Planctomycetota bacterium]|jgi:RNA polymerase sigma factor (sigma-70 family)